jgi:toxin FitB
VHLVDTNVVSELMRPRPAPAVLRWAARVSRFALSVVSVEEISFGLCLKRSDRLERWFEDFSRDYCDILPVTSSIARLGGGTARTVRGGVATC